MIRPEDIAEYSPELRELLEFSCFYLAATDHQFTSIEQEWIDAHFGEGSADRFTTHYLNNDWPSTFDRIIGIVRHSLTESEKQIVAWQARDWLQNFITADGLEPEEQIRLDEFYQWLEEAGLPKRKIGLPPKPPVFQTFRITAAGNPSGTGKQKPLPDMTQPDTKKKRKSWRPTRPIVGPILGIFFILLLCLCIHGLFFGSYIPWDVKKEIIGPLRVLGILFLLTFPIFGAVLLGSLFAMFFRRTDEQSVAGAGESGAGQVGYVFGFFIGCFLASMIGMIVLDLNETYFEKLHKPTPKEIKEGWKPSR